MNSSRAFDIGLLLFTGIAFVLRLQYCYEGLPYLHYWDEPQLASTALSMMRSGDFNPHFFNYGSLMIELNLLMDCVHALSLLGAPPRTGQSLQNVGEIVINADTGWHWTISHPSFYFWNRIITAVMGSLTIPLVGRLGKQLMGPVAGLTAAAVLTGLTVHIEESALISNDAPVTFWVILATFGCGAWMVEGRAAGWRWALIVCGLAVSCKYNSGIALLLPLTALGISAWEGRLPPRWPLALLLMPLSFLLTTPYAILDLPHFLNDVGYELRHYKVLGHGISTVTPGWPNLRRQLEQFWDNLGPLLLLGLGGGLWSLRLRRGWLLWLFPVVYCAYMSNTRIDFHRNFLVIYPFLAIGVGIVVEGFYRRIQGRFPRSIWGISVVFLLWCVAAIPGALQARQPETRSDLIHQLRASDYQRIGLPTELHFHGIDIATLKGRDVQEAPLQTLLCGSDRQVVAVPVAFIATDDVLLADFLNRLLPPIEAVLLHGRPGKGTFPLDAPAINPQLRLVPPVAPDCSLWMVSAAQLLTPPGTAAEGEKLHLGPLQAAVTPEHPVTPGLYRGSWRVMAKEKNGPERRILLEAWMSGRKLASIERVAKNDWSYIDLPVTVTESGPLLFSITSLETESSRWVDIQGMIGGVEK